VSTSLLLSRSGSNGRPNLTPSAAHNTLGRLAVLASEHRSVPQQPTILRPTKLLWTFAI
jgi:hypothetical protein